MSSWNLTAVGFTAGLLVSLGLIKGAPRLGWLDHPNEDRKSHECPTALTGGLALWFVLVLAQILGWLPFTLHPVEWLGIHGMALMGALDDRCGLRARYKAVVGLAVALMLAGQSSLLLAHTVDHVQIFLFRMPTHPLLTVPLLALWFWGSPQAYNLLDGINGLSMGIGILILGVLGLHMAAMPAVLVEVAFISNPKEEAKLNDPAFRARVADAITQGVRRYFAETNGSVRRRTVGGPG